MNESIDTQENTDNEFTVTLHNSFIYVAICFLFGVLCAALSILTTSSTASSENNVVYIFFISIVIVAICIKHYKLFGVITALVSSLLFCVALKYDVYKSLINVSINTFQALLIYFSFKILEKKNNSSYVKNNSLHNAFMFIQLLIGVIFMFGGLFLSDVKVFVRILVSVEIIIYIAFAVSQKKVYTVLFLLLLCLLPSLICGTINGFLQFDITLSDKLNLIETWLFSNFILLSSFGYIFLEYLNIYKKTSKLVFCEVTVKVTTILYYGSALIWNVGYFFLYYVGWLGSLILPYLLSWVVGNIFLLANMYFNSQIEVKEKDATTAFEWYENRAVVAEKNTQFLISIITFLLPITSSLFGKTLDTGIITLFCINITCACVAIGLIWIPQKQVKTMSLIKTLKTIFHLLTVSILLLSATMIIIP